MSADARAIRLRDATPADLPAIARVHLDAYSRDHFLALLPGHTLADYYARFLGGGSRIVLAARENAPMGGGGEAVVGFAVFGRDIEPRIAIFKREQRLAILQTALTHPVLATRKAVAATLAWRNDPGVHKPAPVLLLSIAVRERGSGVGRLLLNHLVQTCAASGEARIGLYVRHRNVVAINAYLAVGFRIIETITDQYYMERSLSRVSPMDNT